MITTWIVLAEAAWLLRHSHDGIVRLLGLVSGGVVWCPDFDVQAAAWMAECIHKYESLGPQLADVSLLYLAGREGISTIFTLDRRDFTVFRSDRGTAFQLIPT
jgi:hypothetical protein